MKKSYLLLFVSFLICFSCHQRISEKPKSSPIERQLEEQTDVFHLLGKHVYSLDSILEGEDKKAELIFLFNFYDCGSCVDSGFQIVKRIDKFYGHKSVPVISSMGSPVQDQVRNQYQEYIYSDKNDLVRKELKYVQTPILIKINDRKEITNYIFPNLSDEQEYKRFFHSISDSLDLYFK